jgi:chromosome segregation ATPase
MKAYRLALSAILAAGLTAALPTSARAQYPGGPNSALAEQRKQIKDAEADVAKIRGEMNKIKAKLAVKFEGKEDWETAKTNLKKAENEYEASRKKAMAKLYASPDYKAAKDKQLKAEQAITANQAGAAKADARALERAQQDRLDAGLALRKLETDALAADPKIAESKEKLAEAKNGWDALQDELKEALEQDPDYVAAKTEMEQAQAQVDQMKASLAQQAAAERESRRQQLEAQRQSRQPTRSGGGGYGGGGYGRGR